MVLWTVRYPEHAGDVVVPPADVPCVAWIAAGATVVAAAWLAWLLAMPLQDMGSAGYSAVIQKVPRPSRWSRSGIGRGRGVLPWFVSRGLVVPELPPREPGALQHRPSLERADSAARRAFTIGNWCLEPMLSLIIVVLCLAYSLACVEAAAARSAEMHALVLLAAFAASFVLLVSSATAVVGGCSASSLHRR